MNRKIRSICITLIAACSITTSEVKAQNLPKVDNTRIEYKDRYHNMEELPKVKYHLWPKVSGKVNVLGFFDAIEQSYYITPWTVAHVYFHPEEDEGLGDNVATNVVVDPKKGYLRVDYDPYNRLKNFVECTYWNKKDGTKLVALNFDYDWDEDGQIFEKGKAHDILFYEYQPETRLLKPIAPPIEGNVDLTGVTLPREGRDLLLPGNKKLVWQDGYFKAEARKATQMNGTASIPEISPCLIGKTFDFSEQAIKDFKENNDDGMYEDIYDIVGQGCSFYCGCEIGTQRASSTLKPQGKQNYKASNAHDLSYYTAWVEGVPGDGVGEWIEYTLPAENPRITQICIANGIVRTKKAWTENSRVEALEVSVNGKKHCMLYLKDVYAEQWFDVPTIGYDDRDHLEGKAPLVIRFKICSVYPGTKYKDTGISEIYFDGLDVH